MEEYVKRLCACGWRADNATLVVTAFFRRLDFEGAAEFVRLIEAEKRGRRE